MRCSIERNSNNPLYDCKTTLTNLKAGENKFYIRCKDKPFEGVPEENRVVNTIDKEYTIRTAEKPLVITSTEPSGEMTKSANPPISLYLQLKTEGGTQNGKATCYYNDNGNWEKFFVSESTIHRQEPFLFEKAGETIIPVKCGDGDGDEAEGEIKLTLNIDAKAPNMTRVYLSGGTLKLVIDEQGTCKVSTTEGLFDYDKEGTLMSASADGKTHTTTWGSGKTYYIICEDKYGNRNSKCLAEVQPVVIK